MGKRRGSTRVVGHATFRGRMVKVYDNKETKGINATIFAKPSEIPGPFGKEFGPISMHITGLGPVHHKMRKSARRVAGGRVVPVLEADLS